MSACMLGCGGGSSETTAAPAPAPAYPESVQSVWDHHLGAFLAFDNVSILKDYDEDSVIATFNDKCAGTADGTAGAGYKEYKGIQQIQEFFTKLFMQIGTAGNVGGVGPSGGAPVVREGSLAESTVFLTWKAVNGTPSLEWVTDSFTFKKTGTKYVIDKQNIVSTETAADCSAADGNKQLNSCSGDVVCHAWQNHFAAFAEQNVSKIMLDYVAESIIYVMDYTTSAFTTHSGLQEIEAFFTGAFAAQTASPGVAPLVEAIDEAKKTVFLVWKDNTAFEKATDTFIFDANSKIITQNIVVTTKSQLSVQV